MNRLKMFTGLTVLYASVLSAQTNVFWHNVNLHTSVNTNLVGAAVGEGLSFSNGVLSVTGGGISAGNAVFSNAVLSVGLDIGTNGVAAVNGTEAVSGDFPVDGTATTVGGLLAALAAAVAWLKRKTAEIEDNVGTANEDLENALNGENT